MEGKKKYIFTEIARQLDSWNGAIYTIKDEQSQDNS